MSTNCPICEAENCDNIILDLLICNNCSHIFKKEPEIQPLFTENLHTYRYPVRQLRHLVESMEPGEKLLFKLPTMAFFDLELRPSQFYDSHYNHYFNQVSLMLLFKRCGLKPLTQTNIWNNKMAISKILAEKER